MIMRYRAFPTCSSRSAPHPVVSPEATAVAAARTADSIGGRDSSFDGSGANPCFDVTPATSVVLRMAMDVEADPVEVAAWYRDTRIAELGDLTAAQLVSLGRANDVIMFLCAVREGRRG
jgi:hypothetical protein